MKNFLKVLLLGTILVSGKFSFAGIGATPASQIDFSRLKEAPAAIAAESSSTAAASTAKIAATNSALVSAYNPTTKAMESATVVAGGGAVRTVRFSGGDTAVFAGNDLTQTALRSYSPAPSGVAAASTSASTAASAAASASSSASNTATSAASSVNAYMGRDGWLYTSDGGIYTQSASGAWTRVGTGSDVFKTAMESPLPTDKLGTFANGNFSLATSSTSGAASNTATSAASGAASTAASTSGAATGGDTSAFVDKFVQDNVGKGVYGVDTNIASKYDLDMGNTTNININTTNYNVVNSDGATIETAAGNFQKGIGNTVVDPKTGETVGNISMDGKVVTIKGTNIQFQNVGSNAAQSLAAQSAAVLAAKAIYMGASDAGAKLAGYAADAATTSLTDTVVQNAVKSLGETAPNVFRSPVVETGILGTLKNLYRGDTGYEAGFEALHSKLSETASKAVTSVYNGVMPETMKDAMIAAGRSPEEIAQVSSEIAALSPQVRAEGIAAAEAVPGSDAAKAVAAAEAETSKELGDKAATVKETTQLLPEKTLVFNVPEYALGILEALEAVKTDDATKEVKVKAQEFQESQGAQFESKLVKVEENPMSATTVASAVTVMRSLLKNNKIDLGLLSVDLKDGTTTKASGLRGSASQAAIGNSGPTGPGSSLTTRERLEVKRRRNLLLGEWAAAATQIGEGSNAISKAFYDRVSDFAQAANNATGTLGGLSAMNDSDRFVLFEITRGAALSAIELGLKGAVNLGDLEEVIATAAKDN